MDYFLAVPLGSFSLGNFLPLLFYIFALIQKKIHLQNQFQAAFPQHFPKGFLEFQISGLNF